MGRITCGNGDQWHLVSFSSYPKHLGYVYVGPMGDFWRQNTSIPKPKFTAILRKNILILKKEFGALFRTKKNFRERITLLCCADVKASENKLCKVA